MNELRLRSRREDDEFEKRISKRFCFGIFLKNEEKNGVNDEPTAPLSYENGESSTTAGDAEDNITIANDANKESTTTASYDNGAVTATAGEANRKSTTTASDDKGESTSTAGDADAESTTTASDEKGGSTTAACDADTESTTTASGDNGVSTAGDANRESSATTSDDNREPTTTASDDNGEPTATASSAAGKSTAIATDENTATATVGKKGTTVIYRHGIKEANDSSSEVNNHYIVPGTVVWAAYGRKPSRYLGVVIPSIPRVQTNSPHYRNVYWLGEHTISKVPTKNIKHFLDREVYKERIEVPLRASGIPEAVQVICHQHKLSDGIPNPRTLDQFISWIKKEHFSQCDYAIPSTILKEVEAISNKGITIDPEDGPSRSSENVQMINFAIDFEDRDPKTICLGCREVTSSKEPHPLVEGFLCRNCYMRVMENHMVLRLNHKNFRYCFLCGWLDKYVFCKTCKRVICRTCIMFWFEEETYQTAAKYAFRWTCIFCVQPNGSPVCNTKLRMLSSLDVNGNTQVGTLTCEESHWPQQREVNLMGNEDEEKPALRVLSLFDGICTGMMALSNLGIKVEKYFASEIDSDAIMVTRCKFGDFVEQIGDVKDITSESIKKCLPIHLLIGGSPCNDLSKVNHSRKGLTDLNGSGSLFFEFYRVMKLIDDHQGHPRTFFYLFENVSSMDAMHKNTMSRFFESSPICIDAKFMAAMSRPRLYWGNIPQMGTLAKEFLLNAKDCKKTRLQDHLTPNLRRKATVKQIRTVTTNNNSLTKNDGSPQVMMAGEASTLSVTEIEKIFGLPEHYTDVMNLTPNTRRRLLGKAWCVHVIQALFRPLAEVFQLEDGEGPPVECVLGE